MSHSQSILKFSSPYCARIANKDLKNLPDNIKTNNLIINKADEQVNDFIFSKEFTKFKTDPTDNTLKICNDIFLKF